MIATLADRPTRQQLLDSFLCDSGRTILRALAERQPCQASEVQAALAGQVGKSNFWPVWKSLQVRGLIAERDDGLYEIGPHWLADLIG